MDKSALSSLLKSANVMVDAGFKWEDIRIVLVSSLYDAEISEFIKDFSTLDPARVKVIGARALALSHEKMGTKEKILKTSKSLEAIFKAWASAAKEKAPRPKDEAVETSVNEKEVISNDKKAGESKNSDVRETISPKVGPRSLAHEAFAKDALVVLPEEEGSINEGGIEALFEELFSTNGLASFNHAPNSVAAAFKRQLRILVDRDGGINKVAEKMGKAPSSLSRFLNKDHSPSESYVIQLGQALGLSYNDLEKLFYECKKRVERPLVTKVRSGQ